MKFSESWLKERIVNIKADLLERFTMAGLEIEAIEPVANPFTHVVVGEVLSTEKHPDAEKLTVCRVNIGEAEPLQIVCGAANVKAQVKVAVATIGAVLSKELSIKKSKLRGVDSYGMLCSATELGLAETANGILLLDDDAPIGCDLREYLQLDDRAIELNLTPNRGDCLSIEGIAREASALSEVEYQPLAITPVKAENNDSLGIEITAKEQCPHYVGRTIRDVNINAKTPLWMSEKLRRSGIRSIDPIVDVTNYVMIELGQPLHAFDLDTLNERIIVRNALPKEMITLLDGQQIELDDDVLVIADEKAPLAIAGIMGGANSGVNPATENIFLESAFFTPQLLAGKARRYGLHTDSSHRFERGVDVNLQRIAIERATELLLQITGGSPGPVIEEIEPLYCPKPKTVKLRRKRLAHVLGCTVPDDKVTAILERLGMEVINLDDGWQVAIPSYRFDISIEEDLIEEVGRVYGYNNIPSKKITTELQANPVSECQLSLRQIKQRLVQRDYAEAVTYSFVDPKMQALLHQDQEPYCLLNPISLELSQMRLSLLPGLLTTLLYNRNRQQNRLRFFETGLRFIKNSQDELSQDLMIAGIATGPLFPEQWGVNNRLIDFFDVKGDVEALLALTHDDSAFHFEPLTNSTVLHPGQSANIVRSGAIIGQIGALHPRVMQNLEINDPIYIFELLFNDLAPAKLPKFATLSKYPAIRRDIAILVDEAVSAEELCNTICENAGELLVDLKIFDVYQGDKAKTGQKSIAFRLVLQRKDRTLIDDEVNQLFDRVVYALSNQHRAVLRT